MSLVRLLGAAVDLRSSFVIDAALVARQRLEREIKIGHRQCGILDDHLIDQPLACISLGIGAPQDGGDLVALAA